MRFIRKGGRVIPISDKGQRVIKGAAKDAASSGVTTAILNNVALHASVKESAKIGLKAAAIFGGLSLGVRAAIAYGGKKSAGPRDMSGASSAERGQLRRELKDPKKRAAFVKRFGGLPKYK